MAMRFRLPANAARMAWMTVAVTIGLMAGPALANAPAPAVLGSGVADGAPVDAIVVRKAERVMLLFAQGRVVATIPHIQLGAVPVGPKHFIGDQRTPEGRYTIDFGKDDSTYHLALHISYPSLEDSALAKAMGRRPGGAVYIHGQPNDWVKGRVPGDWTAGCIALSNAEIATLWRLVPDGTPIDIRP